MWGEKKGSRSVKARGHENGGAKVGEGRSKPALAKKNEKQGRKRFLGGQFAVVTTMTKESGQKYKGGVCTL